MNTSYKLSVFIFLFIFQFSLSAQPTDQIGIMKPINALFEGMNKMDSILVKDAFTADATLVSLVKDKEGNPMLRRGDLERFIKGMGTPHKEIYSEPIWDVKMEIDGNFAQVWAKYAFYLDKEFHHCGVDAFHLFKTENEWKIFHLADTRQVDGCEIPQAIKNRFQ